MSAKKAEKYRKLPISVKKNINIVLRDVNPGGKNKKRITWTEGQESHKS